jgi:transcriptional regulator GlxA family with amidase domain
MKSPQAGILHADALVLAFESWTREHIAEPFSLQRAGSAIGTSERTLARRVHAVFGRPPLQFVQDIRAQKAIELLSDGSISIEKAACAVGYANASTLRVVLRMRLGVGLRDLRVRS